MRVRATGGCGKRRRGRESKNAPLRPQAQACGSRHPPTWPPPSSSLPSLIASRRTHHSKNPQFPPPPSYNPNPPFFVFLLEYLLFLLLFQCCSSSSGGARRRARERESEESLGEMGECRGGGGDGLIKLFGKTIPVQPDAKVGFVPVLPRSIRIVVSCFFFSLFLFFSFDSWLCVSWGIFGLGLCSVILVCLLSSSAAKILFFFFLLSEGIGGLPKVQ